MERILTAMGSYEETLETNKEILAQVSQFLESYDCAILVTIYTLLLPYSKQEALRIISKKSLPRDYLDDMLQDSYLRLQDAVMAFDFDRCPSFISFWRTTFSNHLLTKYGHHKTSLQLDGHPWRDIRTSLDAKLILEELVTKYEEEVAKWEGDSRKQIPMLQEILYHRVLCLPEDRDYQKEIGKKFNVSQGFVSAWERWLISKLRDYCPELQSIERSPMLQSTPQSSVHEFECVVAVKLNSDLYKVDDVRNILQEYLVNALPEPFACAIVDVKKKDGPWYHLLIRYSVGLESIFKLLLNPAWILDAEAKPSSEF